MDPKLKKNAWNFSDFLHEVTVPLRHEVALMHLNMKHFKSRTTCPLKVK